MAALHASMHCLSAPLAGGSNADAESPPGLTIFNMKENKLSVEILKPVKTVFAFIINPDNTSLWVKSIVREEVDSFPIRIGTRYTNWDNKNTRTDYIVVQFKQDSIFEMKQQGGDYHVRYTCEPISETKTRLTYFEWVDEGNINNPFTAEVLDKLKEVIEARE